MNGLTLFRLPLVNPCVRACPLPLVKTMPQTPLYFFMYHLRGERTPTESFCGEAARRGEAFVSVCAKRRGSIIFILLPLRRHIAATRNARCGMKSKLNATPLLDHILELGASSLALRHENLDNDHHQGHEQQQDADDRQGQADISGGHGEGAEQTSHIRALRQLFEQQVLLEEVSGHDVAAYHSDNHGHKLGRGHIKD